MSDPLELVGAAEAAAKSARRAVVLALVAVAVAVAVLAIDNGIKRSILEEAERARRILADFKSTVLEASYGATGPDTASSDANPDGGNAVADPAGTSPPADGDAGRTAGAAGRAPASRSRRTGGHE